MRRPCKDEEEVRTILTGWPVQALVLVSFLLQVLLFALAGFRRRSASRFLRAILWLAYLGADSVATYTLGHLSIATSSDKHLLVALWAPFLLHLGGQDTITAYALEDNKLWLRHLQTLFVQVLAAAYIVFWYASTNGWALLTAAVLMLLAGATKYGERICALKCASDDGMYSFLISYCKESPPAAALDHDAHVEAGRRLLDPFGTKEEKVMYGAHSLLGISMCMFLYREEETCRHNNGALSVLAYLCSVADADNADKISIYRVVEMELSLIYDLTYTKARVIHTVYGFCIRVVSLLIIFFTGILLFLLVINEDTADVRITYLLLAGAFVMEVASGFLLIVSTWTRHHLNKCTGNWRKLYTLVVFLRGSGRWRSWSRTVGQFNMIEYCTKAPLRVSDNICGLQVPFRVPDYYICGIPLRKEENISGLTPPVQVSADMKHLIRTEIARVAESCGGATERMYALVRSKELLEDHSNFDRRVIIWHIATHLILDSINKMDDIQDQEKIKAKETKTLSDYMMFLLVEQPHMMPGHTRRNLYMEAIKSLKDLGDQDYEEPGDIIDLASEEPEDYIDLVKESTSIATRLLAKGREVPAGGDTQEVDSTFMKGATLAISVLDKPWSLQHLLDEMFGVWVEMLLYAGSQCTRDSHLRRLTSGGEFLTIVWLLAGHFADYEHLKQGRGDSHI